MMRIPVGPAIAVEDVVTLRNYNDWVWFEWDESKGRTILRKHGIDFVGIWRTLSLRHPDHVFIAHDLAGVERLGHLRHG